MSSGIEIERKYIIKMPDVPTLRAMPEYTESEITQTYLAPLEIGSTERVRRRVFADTKRFYHTVKKRIDSMSCLEDEREISEEEYLTLLSGRDASARPIEKTRYTFSYDGLTVEIDKYAPWDSIAVLEVELPSRDVEPSLPDFIEIVFEATGNRAFSNAALAARFPSEDEVLSSYL